MEILKDKEVVRNKFTTVINLLFLLLTQIALINNFIFAITKKFKTNYLFIILFLIATILFVVIMEYLSRKIRYFFVSSSIIACILQLILFGNCIRQTGWDGGTIVNTAIEFADHVKQHSAASYFASTPKDAYMVSFLCLLFLLFGSFAEYWTIAAITTLVLADITIVLSYLISRKLFDESYARIVFFISMIFIGFNPWIIIPWNDVLGMVFIAAEVYLCLLIKEATGRKQLILSGVFGAVAISGYAICSYSVIITAVVIIALLRRDRSETVEKKVLSKNVRIAVISAICALAIWAIPTSLLLSQMTNRQEIYDNRIDITHYINEGLIKKYGAFNADSFNVMYEIKGLNNKRAYNIQEIRDRLDEFEFKGYCQFLLNKYAYIFVDGTFSFGGNGFYASEPKSEATIFNYWNADKDEYKNITGNLFEAIWILLLFVLMVGSYFDFKNKNTDDAILLLRIAIIVLIAFFLIYEARRRLIINYLPILIIMAGQGIKSLVEEKGELLVKKDRTSDSDGVTGSKTMTQ